MKEVSGNMRKVTGVASTLFATPLIKASALLHGLRGAAVRRRPQVGPPGARRLP